ncbi:MAG: hypothetical protein F6K36_11895 [Symploca sp. SIO3C6]|nr:hypothetical protein [Symploca sp. SIO3C6]
MKALTPHPTLKRRGLCLPLCKTGHVYFVDGQLWGRIRGPLATELIIDQVGKIFLDNEVS